MPANRPTLPILSVLLALTAGLCGAGGTLAAVWSTSLGWNLGEAEELALIATPGVLSGLGALVGTGLGLVCIFRPGATTADRALAGLGVFFGGAVLIGVLAWSGLIAALSALAAFAWH